MAELSKPTISNTQTLVNPQVNRCTSVQVACMSYMDLALGAFLQMYSYGATGGLDFQGRCQLCSITFQDKANVDSIVEIVMSSML